MRILLMSVGKNFDRQLEPAIETFTKRLGHTMKAEWILLPHTASGPPDTSKRLQAENILKALPTSAYVIALDEHGTQLTTPQLAEKLEQLEVRSTQNVVFIIGGSYGLSQSVLQRADLVWSLSPLVFPHQIVRLILVEQLYRAQAIRHNHPYHHA